MFATDDTEIVDELLTRRIVEIFRRHGLALPAHIAITFTGNVILRGPLGRHALDVIMNIYRADKLRSRLDSVE
jgi:hypothetical protein